MDLSVRRSEVGDIPAILALAADDDFILKKRYGAALNFHHLIETAFLSVTITDAARGDRVVGFAAFTDRPKSAGGAIPYADWDGFLKAGWLSAREVSTVSPCNTTWLACLVADPAAEYDVAMKMLTTALATMPQVDNVLVPLGADVPAFSPVCDIFTAVAESNAGTRPEGFAGRVYKVTRAEIIPELQLRAGVVQDYDDLMPLLLSGDGVVTPLPDNLFLEELLQNQDEYHAVVVATDRHTEQVVGLMCLRATYTEQHDVVRQYSTDVFNKLKPVLPPTHKGQQAGHNSVLISFFYLNPAYDNCSGQFLPHAFDKFPFAEYCMTYLPHEAPVHALLHSFAYVPIKKLQPSNLQGERLPLPEGLYLCCRYSLDDVAAVPVAGAHEAAVTKMMTTQSELSQDMSEATCVALTQSIQVVGDDGRDGSNLPFQSFVVTWRDNVVGVAVTRPCTVEEMHSLRANFDIEAFVNFAPEGNANMAASDISADPLAAPATYHRDAMPGVVLKHCYVKPIFRPRLRFILREVLRLTGAETILYPAGAASEVFTPLVAELVLALPRRVTEFALPSTDTSEAPPAADVDGLLTLHHTTQKLLSDEKTHINARIVVVGSGTTGLAFIYSLLVIPYLQFSNIVLVSKDGLPQHPMQRDLMWTTDSMDWTEREYLALRVGKKVRVIEGTMIDFDRTDKYIYTDNATCEPYDHLVLTVGRQYTIPVALHKQNSAKNGVFPLSNANAIAKIKQHIHESEIYEDERSRAVIYGSNLDVYAIASCVIQLGLGASRIVVVCPDGGGYSAFGDDVCDKKVDELFESLQIQQHRGHRLERLEFDEDNTLTQVVITPTGDRADGAVKQIELDATMMIYAHEKDIDKEVLSALNKRSIVFDGRVIVNNCYRTTDKSIYAAGPVAMFSRRFGPCQDFDVFNTLELGRHLCHTVLGFLGIDEFQQQQDEGDDEGDSYVPKDDPLAAQLGTFREAAPEDLARRRPKPLPTYSENICRRVVVPTGLIYFSCHTVDFAETDVATHCEYLTSFSEETNPTPGGATDAEGRTVEKSYLRLAISPNRRIESVVFLGRDPREMSNFRSLVGTSEATLNLAYNYNECPGLDVQLFLRSIWARAIFHDRFVAATAAIKQRLQGHPDVAAVKADMLAKLRASGDKTLGKLDRDAALLRLTDAHGDARHAIELELIKFLHDHKAFVPQHYYLPDISAHVQAATSL
jgi:hypothetical protein